MILRTAVVLLLAALGAFGQSLTITTPATPPVGIQGHSYILPLTVSGGHPPYLWSVTSGLLPDGLMLVDDQITGTPTGQSVLSFDVTVVDASTAAATKTITLTTQHIYGPYGSPEEVTICQMDMSQTPPGPAVDEVTRLSRCFVVPAVVSDSMTRHLLTQTEGLDGAGNVKYRYASWWDYVIKFFINGLVLPVMDEFPSPELTAAKDQAKTAAEAVDAAKAAILQQRQ